MSRSTQITCDECGKDFESGSRAVFHGEDNGMICICPVGEYAEDNEEIMDDFDNGLGGGSDICPSCIMSYLRKLLMQQAADAGVGELPEVK